MRTRASEAIQRRRTLARRATAAAIILVIAGLFMQREFLTDEASSGGSGGAASRLGLLDDRAAEAGRAAPDFALRAVDGKTARLSDYRGKTVVLNFWATWCPPCAEEMPEFNALYRQRLDRGDFVVLAVDYLPLDSEAAVRRFAETRELAFPVLLDTADGAVAERYGVAPRNASRATLPVSFFIDRDGVLRDKVLGPVLGGVLEAKVGATDAAGRGGP